MPEKNIHGTYDDDTLERMKRYFRLANDKELLRYIKTHGVRRHADMLEDDKESS
jgi:hypothetical protein